MGQSTKAVVQFLLLILCCASIGVWMAESSLAMRIGLPIGAALLAAVLIWAGNRDDKAPDILAELIGWYFERNGFCFAIVPTVLDYQFTVDIFFQNRYAKPCRARLVLRHCTFLPKRQKNKLKQIGLTIDCAGGECGVVHVPLAVPKEYAGTQQKFDVGADVDYPNGRGELIRYREGVPVGGTTFPTVPRLAQTPARYEMSFPLDCDESLPKNAKPVTESIWQREEFL